MSIIYTPKGRAREYSPLALNIYLSCTHGCEYCYAPSCRNQTREEYFRKPYPRKNIVENLKDELRYNSPKEQVLLSFIGDVYCETMDDNKATREVLETLLENKVPVAVLTKGAKRCLRDIDLFEEFGEHIQIGTTLTFDNEKDSKEWESGAATPDERIEMLEVLHDNGIKTFASFEPVIYPEQSLHLIEETLDVVDVYKIGKINNYNGIDQKINWTSFLEKAVDILRDNGKAFYVKHDLRECARSVRLYGNEVLADEHCVR